MQGQNTMMQRRSFLGGLVASAAALIRGRRAYASTTGDIGPTQPTTSSVASARIEAGCMVRTLFVNDYFVNGDCRIPANTLMHAIHNPRVVMDGQFYVDQTQVACSWDMEIDGHIHTCRRLFAVWQLKIADTSPSSSSSSSPATESIWV